MKATIRASYGTEKPFFDITVVIEETKPGFDPWGDVLRQGVSISKQKDLDLLCRKLHHKPLFRSMHKFTLGDEIVEKVLTQTTMCGNYVYDGRAKVKFMIDEDNVLRIHYDGKMRHASSPNADSPADATLQMNIADLMRDILSPTIIACIHAIRRVLLNHDIGVWIPDAETNVSNDHGVFYHGTS